MQREIRRGVSNIKWLVESVKRRGHFATRWIKCDWRWKTCVKNFAIKCDGHWQAHARWKLRIGQGHFNSGHQTSLWINTCHHFGALWIDQQNLIRLAISARAKTGWNNGWILSKCQRGGRVGWIATKENQRRQRQFAAHHFTERFQCGSLLLQLRVLGSTIHFNIYLILQTSQRNARHHDLGVSALACDELNSLIFALKLW